MYHLNNLSRLAGRQFVDQTIAVLTAANLVMTKHGELIAEDLIVLDRAEELRPRQVRLGELLVDESRNLRSLAPRQLAVSDHETQEMTCFASRDIINKLLARMEDGKVVDEEHVAQLEPYLSDCLPRLVRYRWRIFSRQ